MHRRSSMTCSSSHQENCVHQNTISHKDFHIFFHGLGFSRQAHNHGLLRNAAIGFVVDHADEASGQASHGCYLLAFHLQIIQEGVAFLHQKWRD